MCINIRFPFLFSNEDDQLYFQCCNKGNEKIGVVRQ